MTEPLPLAAGRALRWNAVQLLTSRGLSAVRTLVLARLLVPDDFGLVAVATITVETTLSISQLGIERALVALHDDDDRYWHTAWTVKVLRAGLAAIALVLVAPLVSRHLFHAPEASGLLRLLALRPLVEAFASVKLAKLTRDLQFRQHAVLSTTASFIDVVIAVSLATTIGPWAIVVGLLARATATSALSYVLAPYRPRWLIDRVALGAIWQFGRWVALTSVITIAGNLALQAVISRRLGTTDLGIYALSLTLANLPEDTAASVVGGVAFPVHARVQDDVERTRRALQAHLTAMAVLVLPVYAAIMVLAPGGAETVLGERWSDAGQLIVLLSAASVIGIVADVVIPLFEGMRQPSRVTALLAVRTAVILTTVSWLAGAHGLLGAGIAIVIAELAVLVLAATLAARAVPHAWDGSERPLAGIAACAAMGAALALAIRTLGSGTIAVGMVGALAVATSLGALMWLDRVLALGIRRDAARAFPALAGTRPAPGVDERVR